MAESGTSDPQAEALSSMMMPMLVLLGMMVLLSINEGIRQGLADAAGTVIEPVLPYDGEFFVLTVFLVGTTMMVVNTIIRGVFMDPIVQLHLSHRSKEIRKQLMDARQSRDTARIEKMNRLQMEMTPESAKMTAMTMKPMMYTIVFVIGIFTWIGYSVEEFRVTYVSLPWMPEWGFEERFLFIFPAWVAIYIMLSAPFGRIIDRHIKIFRLSRHNLVLSGDKIQEPSCTFWRTSDLLKAGLVPNAQGKERSHPTGKLRLGHLEDHRSRAQHLVARHAGTRKLRRPLGAPCDVVCV